jgi:hypothetical protein
MLLGLVTVVFSFSVSLLFAEMVLRVNDWYRSPKPGTLQLDQDVTYVFSATRHHRLIPSARYRHKEIEYDYLWANNSLGMRDRERSVEKDPDSFRIIFLGDSMVQGYGVPFEQSMVYRLETSLNQPLREQKLEVFNGGVFGYSPMLEYFYLKELLPLVSPDLVLVGFFLGNDVGDDYFYSQEALVSEENGSVYFADMKWPWDYHNEILDTEARVAVSDKPETNSINSRRLTPRGYLKSVLLKTHIGRAIKDVRDRMKKKRDYRDKNERLAKLIEEQKGDININLGLINYPVGTKEQRREYWRISISYLKKMHQLCKADGIPMALVVIPVLEPEVNQFEEPYKVMEEIGQELSVPVIHLLPEMRRWSAEDLVYELDGHWNAEGNRLAATIVDKELRNLHLLPASLASED